MPDTTHAFSFKKYHTMIVGTIEITLDDDALILLRGCSVMKRHDATDDREIARRMVERAIRGAGLRVIYQREFVAEELPAALKLAYEHVLELRDAWERGAIHETDNLGGERSNRNVDVEVALREFAKEEK